MRKLLSVSNLFLTLFISLGILAVLLQIACNVIDRGDLSAMIGTWGIRSANIFGALLGVCSYILAQLARRKGKAT